MRSRHHNDRHDDNRNKHNDDHNRLTNDDDHGDDVLSVQYNRPARLDDNKQHDD